MRARVIATHRAPPREPIQVAPGQPVTLGERATEWPDFVWATLAQGLGGWVPAALFDRDAGEAVALDAYDTRELDADPGDILALHRQQAGWWRAGNVGGHSGWIPARCIEPIEETSA